MLIEVVDDAPVPYYSYLGPDGDRSPVTWPECVATVQLSYGGDLVVRSFTEPTKPTVSMFF